MDNQDCVDTAKTSPAVLITGTAEHCRIGPQIGRFDIGESESAYLFRVLLPGVQKDHGKLSCKIQKDGKVLITGEVSSIKLLKDTSSVYQMSVQELCPPGPFSVNFNLPGPVDPRLTTRELRPDGILEVMVMKVQSPLMPVPVNSQFPAL